MVIAGQLFQRGAGIGDGDKVLAGFLALKLPLFIEKVFEMRERLDGATRFGGDDKQRGIEINLLLDRVDSIGIGGIEHKQVQVARSGAEGQAQHLRAEAAAAHTEQDRAFIAKLPQLVDKVGNLVALRLHVLATVSQPRRSLIFSCTAGSDFQREASCCQMRAAACCWSRIAQLLATACSASRGATKLAPVFCVLMSESPAPL